jgi:hypothetical protein
MTIGKQEFYEGAALYRLAKSGSIKSISFDPPFIIVNGRLLLFIKYCKNGSSRWGFEFTPQECVQLSKASESGTVVIGLVCGSDGVVAVDFDEFRELAGSPAVSIRVACYRKHRELYEVSGPEGVSRRKVPPSRWTRLLENFE